VHETSVVTSSPTDTDVVVETAVRGVAADAASETAHQPLVEPDREPFGRFRRNLERFKGMADGQEFDGSLESEAELKLQLMLLREENARLKAARHQPADIGTVVDRVRLLAAPREGGELVDDAWTILGECLVIREGLDHACAEIQAAVDTVRDRLAELAVKIEATMPSDSSDSDAATQLSA
jgi:hypothetical protein